MNEIPTDPDAAPLPAPTTAAAAAPAALPDLPPAECAARLAALFPAVFGAGGPQPLKLRIQADIQQRSPGIFTKKSLSAFLHRYTTGTAYIRALANAPQRVDLDGAPAGEVSDEHRQAAVAELERRRALHEARRAAEREAQRVARQAQQAAHQAANQAAHKEERRQREAEDEGRQARAALLHAFETTTLTRANFCALKGLAEAELEATLVQARAEREQRARAPRPERRPDPRPPGRGPRPPERGPRPPGDASGPRPPSDAAGPRRARAR